MDPKLQNFLVATGWSKEDLIQQLSAGDNSKETVVSDINRVTSTTPYKDISTQQKPIRSKVLNPHNTIPISKEIYKTSITTGGSTKVPSIGLVSEELAPALLLADDLLLQLNTTNSYLTPTCATITKSVLNDQSDVIDLLSDSESLDSKQTDTHVNVIDISTDSDTDFGAPKSTNGSTLRRSVENSNTSKDSFHWEKYVRNRLKDRDTRGKSYEDAVSDDLPLKSYHKRNRNGSEREISGRDASRLHDKKKEKPARYRSPAHKRERSPSHDHHRKRKHKKKKHRTKSGSRMRKRDRNRSRSTSGSHRGTSRSRSRSRRRSRNKSHTKSSRSKSRTSSLDIETTHRSRKRTRSSERDKVAWYSKLAKSREPALVGGPEDYWERVSPPRSHLSDMMPTPIPLKDAANRLTIGTYKKRPSLPDMPRACNNLSEIKNSRSDTYVEFKNIDAEESKSQSEIVAKQKKQVIKLYRRAVHNYSKDITKEVLDNSSKLDANQIVVKHSLPKNFVESKDKNLATEVSQLISTKDQSNDSLITHSISVSEEPTIITSNSNDKNEELHGNDTIEIDDSPDSLPDLQNTKCQIATDMPTNIEHGDHDELEMKSCDKTCNISDGGVDFLENIVVPGTFSKTNSTEIKPSKCENLPDTSENSFVEQVDVPCAAVAGSSEGINQNVSIIPKLHAALDIHSDLSDITSGDLTDDLDINTANSIGIGKKDTSSQRIIADNVLEVSNGQLSDQTSSLEINRPETFTANNNETDNTQQPEINSYLENLSDISDYVSGDLTDDNDGTIAIKPDDSDSKAELNSAESAPIVENISEIVDPSPDELNGAIRTPEIPLLERLSVDCYTKLVNQLLVEGNEDVSIELKDNTEISLTRSIEDLPNYSHSEIASVIESPLIPHTSHNQLIDGTANTDMNFDKDELDKIITEEEKNISENSPIISLEEDMQISKIDFTEELPKEDVSKTADGSSGLLAGKIITEEEKRISKNSPIISLEEDMQISKIDFTEELPKEDVSKTADGSSDLLADKIMTEEEKHISETSPIISLVEDMQISKIDFTEELPKENVSKTADGSSGLLADNTDTALMKPNKEILIEEDRDKTMNSPDAQSLIDKTSVLSVLEVTDSKGTSLTNPLEIASEDGPVVITTHESAHLTTHAVVSSDQIRDDQEDLVAVTEMPVSSDQLLTDSEDVVMKSVEDPAEICHSNIIINSETQYSATVIPDKCDKDEKYNVDLTSKNSDSDNNIETTVTIVIDANISNRDSKMQSQCVEVDNTSNKRTIEQDDQCLAHSSADSHIIDSTEELFEHSIAKKSKPLESNSLRNTQNILNKIQEYQESLTEAIKNNENEPLLELTNSDKPEQMVVVMEKGIIKHPKHVDDYDTPSLDIEAILQKCKDNQEKAIRDKAAQKNVPPSTVRRAPKNRRPDFKSLRDKSISTIQINLMLEQLSYRNQSAVKDCTSDQQENICEHPTFVKDSTADTISKETTPVQIKVPVSKLSEEKIISEDVSNKDSSLIKSTSLLKSKSTDREHFDVDKPFYNENADDGIRNEILKQLNMLKERRNDSAFSSCINPTVSPKTIRKKTLATLRDMNTKQDDEEEINIVNDNLESPIIWLTKTTDYKKIKGWKNKSIGVRVKKSSQPLLKAIDEDFEVPSCSFHYPSFVDDVIENVVCEKADDLETDYASTTEPKLIQISETADDSVETNAFSSSMLDEFMLDKSKVELKISYEVPELLMGPRIKDTEKIHDNLLKGDIKYGPPGKKELLTKEGNKPRTVAEKRKLLNLEEARNSPSKSSSKNIKDFEFAKPFEVSRYYQKIIARKTVNDDLPNVGHNKRKDFAVGTVYWKGRKYIVPCRERKVIYFRSKIISRYSLINSNDESATTLKSIDSSPNGNTEPPKAILWSPEKIVKKPVTPRFVEQHNILYRAGPMSKKPNLIMDNSKSWKCVVKPLPKVYLEIIAEYGKSLHPRALQFLYAEPFVDLSKDKVEFALTALKDSKPTKYKLPVSYENGQTQFTLRKKEIIEDPQPRTPPACGDISGEVKEVVDDILTCLEIKDMEDTFIKDDPDFDAEDRPKQIPNSPSKKNNQESAVTTRVAAINKRLRIALGRLQVKFIDVNIDEDPNKTCDKEYCQLGCVCSSLLGALSSKEHCRRIECVLGCICGYKPPVNTTVTLPAGSDMDLSSTVDKLQSEATKNLAKVEKEFTQTIVCTKNETYVLGDTADRKRRCTRAPKKYEDFLNVKTVTKEDGETKLAKEEVGLSHSEYVHNKYGVDITDCSVRIEKVDMYHIIPFCWRHEEYQCQCLKDFLIARSEEKASNLALQLDIDANDNFEDNPTSHNEVNSKLSKSGSKKKLKKSKTKLLYVKHMKQLINNNTIKPFEHKVTKQFDEDLGNIEPSAESLNNAVNNPVVSPIVSPDVQENQQTKSTSRRKQVLSTMVDISEAQNVQVEMRKEPVYLKKPVEKPVVKVPQQNQGDMLTFLLPTWNVRLQFLKMLGKNEHAKDDFRLLSFLVLSNRFHRNLFHVWYSRSAPFSKYVLTMDSICPSPDFRNVRQFPKDMKTDNYLIQWLVEGTIPVAEVQDFLVILRVNTSKSFDICGMCEKSKIECTDEPLPPLKPTPLAKVSTATTPTKMPILLPPKKAPTISTVTYDVNGTARQTRKILNIQNEKIATLSCIYPSVALTGQSGLIHASLPSINAKFRWLMLSFSSTFAVLNMTSTNYCIPHEYLVELVEESRQSNCTTLFKNRDIRGQAAHPDFAIYVTPQHKRYFFIGPYHINEDLSCETLCYYKNMLVSTENFNKIHGNAVTPVGCWIKQLQMKVHSVATTANVNVSISPQISVLKPIQPKPPGSALPPKLVKISDYIAEKKRKQAVQFTKQNVSSPNSSFLIVNNSIVCTSAMGASNFAVRGQANSSNISNAPPLKAISPGVRSSNATSQNNIIVAATGSSPNPVEESAIPSSNVADEDICISGMDYRDAEFKDKSNKTLHYLVTNIPGFGYVRIYRCHKTNIVYLMWRFVKMYKTLMEAKKALISLIESTVIIVPSTFKITLSLSNSKPNNLNLVNSDCYFDTYIAGRFGVHLLSNLTASIMVNYLKLTDTDVQYINARSSGMLLKKCYNIASTFLTKDDLAKIRNWKDMMAALKETIEGERQTEALLTETLKNERCRRLMLRDTLKKLNNHEDSLGTNVTADEETSDVIEISDDENDNGELMPKLEPEIISEEQNTIESRFVIGRPLISPEIAPEGNSAITTEIAMENPLIQNRVGESNQTPISNKNKTNTPQQRNIGFVSMAQNFKGSFKLLPHKSNSVLITRVKNSPAVAKTNTNNL